MRTLEWLEWSNPVAIWWVFLVSTSVVNMLAWVWTFKFYSNQRSYHGHVKQGSEYKIRQIVILLAAGYVFGCAFRSFLPRADVQRICLFDTWFSTVLLGRSVATVAELSFVAQWALVLNQFAKEIEDVFVRRASLFIVPMIFVAECFSWYAVISTHYMGNTFEESIWGITYGVITLCLVSIWFKIRGPLRYAVGVAIVGCILYVAFMFSVDVPMYVQRWQADSAAGKNLLGLVEGLHDLNTRWVVTHDIKDWHQEIPWMSLYFSFAVWTSLALCYVPFSKKELHKVLRGTSS